MMLDLPFCCGCLATDVRMYSMSASGLLQPYQDLMRIRIDNEMRVKLCWECAALVNKFNTFRRKCERAHLLLRDIYTQHQENIVDQIRLIDRSEHNLVSPYINQEVHKAELRDKPLRTREKTTDNCTQVKTRITKFKQSSRKTKIVETDDVKFENVMIDESASVKVEVGENTNETEFIKIKDEPESVDADDTFDYAEEAETKYAIDNGIVPKLQSKLRKKSKDYGIEPKIKESKVRKSSKDYKFIEQTMTQKEAKAIYLKRQTSSKYMRARYSCTLCYRSYSNLKACEKHKAKHDPMKGDYECDSCRMRFASRASIRGHINVHHTKKYSCIICNNISFTRDAAKSHYAWHAKVKPVRVKTPKKKKSKVATANDFNTVQVNLTQEQMMSVVLERQYTDGYSTARYKCSLCYKPFNEDKPFSNHMLQHDPLSGAFTCDICKLRYKTRRKLYKHISNNHMHRYSCKSCSHVCYNRASAQKHFAWHSGVVYTCHICGTTSTKMSTHLSHLRIKHPSQHICGECGQSFVSKMGLYHHSNKMHSVKADTGTPDVATIGPYCAECDIQFTSTQVWTKHILISPRHQLERHGIVNGCHVCGETFATPADLKRHHKMDHKRNRRTLPRRSDHQFPVSCAKCDETIPSAGKYWQHFRQQHPGEPFPLTRSTFICEYCGNWFKHKSTLEIHAQTHAGTRLHQCAKCPKKFVKQMSLAAHAESHADGGQHVCDICSRAFAYKHALTNHFRTHAVERPHLCEWCGKSFAYDCNLKKHEQTVHCADVATSSAHV